MRIYNANKTKYNLEAWNKVRIPMVKLQNKEYESVKARDMAARYSSYSGRSKVEELEDRVEELENQVEDLGN